MQGVPDGRRPHFMALYVMVQSCLKGSIYLGMDMGSFIGNYYSILCGIWNRDINILDLVLNNLPVHQEEKQ